MYASASELRSARVSVSELRSARVSVLGSQSAQLSGLSWASANWMAVGRPWAMPMDSYSGMRTGTDAHVKAVAKASS